MTQLFLEGGSPYFMNVNEGVGGCGGTLVPTPQEVIEEDDIPDEVTCAAGTQPYLVALQDSYGDGWNGNVMTIEDCRHESYTPQADPITVDEDAASESLWVCLPTDISSSGGLIVAVDGGEWASEVSWEIIGPCGDEYADDNHGDCELGLGWGLIDLIELDGWIDSAFCMADNDGLRDPR
jgi:hypothetical protein